MLYIDVAFTPTELETKSPHDIRAVLIDVVRATTTIVTALAHGCSSVLPVLTVEQAFQLKRQYSGKAHVLLGGERGGIRVEGFDLGNSPREYTRGTVEGKELIFSTSNGTRTLLALHGASEILIGSFVNISAISEYLITQIQKNPPATLQTSNTKSNYILLACSGVLNTFSLEDTVCAGMFVSLLTHRSPDITKTPSAMAAEILYQHYASDLLHMLHISDGGKRLLPIGFAEDLAECARVDKYQIVPKYKDGKIVRRDGALTLDS